MGRGVSQRRWGVEKNMPLRIRSKAGNQDSSYRGAPPWAGRFMFREGELNEDVL